MRTLNVLRIQARPEAVYALAQDVLEWPRLLRHYRYVRLHAHGPGWRDVTMAAHRDGFPCSWRSRQELFPGRLEIRYRHTHSFWTQGMEVLWRLKRLPGGACEASISHDMPAQNWFLQHVVGELFVMNIAQKTLRGLQARLERP